MQQTGLYLINGELFTNCEGCSTRHSLKELSIIKSKWNDYYACEKCKDYFFPYNYVNQDCHGKKCRYSINIKDDGIWCKSCFGDYDPFWPIYAFTSKEEYENYLNMFIDSL